jgi:aminomuconate-semialdehyde/2-hydroxymuconate-6-semialdehyde dehydrogenase
MNEVLMFVDLENIHRFDLKQAPPNARIKVFAGESQSKLPTDFVEQALAMANDSPYGLCAAVWTQNLSRAHMMASRLEAGLVWINTWFLRDLRTPFGGMKLSGIGREGGAHSVEFYTELKNVCVKM